MKAKNEVSKPVKKQPVALKDLKTKKDPKGGRRGEPVPGAEVYIELEPDNTPSPLK